jgi:hypothetical protein
MPEEYGRNTKDHTPECSCPKMMPKVPLEAIASERRKKKKKRGLKKKKKKKKIKGRWRG